MEDGQEGDVMALADGLREIASGNWGDVSGSVSEECRIAADRIEKLEAALREIAAEAYVSVDDLPPHSYPNGWRKVAVERIDIARTALEQVP